MTCRTFFSPDMERYVLFTESALQNIYSHAQRNWTQKEAGGEIYSPAPNSTRLVVDTVAGPHLQDQRSRHSYNPDLVATDKARKEEYMRGRHAIGLWHTHPERNPNPSGTDRRTTEQYLQAFKKERDRYLSIIIGNRGEIPAMTVWSAEKDGCWQRWNEFHG